MKRKLFILVGILVFGVLGILVFRSTILRGFAQYLIVNEPFEHCQYGFVLSGGAFDRGNKAAELYNTGKIEKIICTGANQSPDLKAFGTDTLESDLTKLQIMKSQVPDSAIELLKKGTSTQEESEAILAFCLNNNIKEIVLISSSFHTRRVKQVFKKKFKEANIATYIQGAPSSVYNEMKWWQNEYGLIALNNEYFKIAYYKLKSY